MVGADGEKKLLTTLDTSVAADIINIGTDFKIAFLGNKGILKSEKASPRVLAKPSGIRRGKQAFLHEPFQGPLRLAHEPFHVLVLLAYLALSAAHEFAAIAVFFGAILPRAPGVQN